MPAAMKIIIQQFLVSQPDISVIDLATIAIADHIVKNGCEFEDGAAETAVNRLALSPYIRASDVPLERIAALGDMLESMETNCPHKDAQTVCLGLN